MIFSVVFRADKKSDGCTSPIDNVYKEKRDHFFLWLCFRYEETSPHLSIRTSLHILLATSGHMPFLNQSLVKRIVLFLDQSAPLLELMMELFLFEVCGYMKEEYIFAQIIVLFGKHKGQPKLYIIHLNELN